MAGEYTKVDVLFVGGGAAGIAGAIHLKRLLNQAGRKESVVVIEKADKLGMHNLSGAVFEADVLDELVPGWEGQDTPFVTKMLANEVKVDETVLLLGSKAARKVPRFLVRPYLRHGGDYVISVDEMLGWLGGIASGLGVEIYNGFVAKELFVEDDTVKGVYLGDKGLNKEGEEQSNYLAGETLHAKVTVLGDGSLGLRSEELTERFGLEGGKNPQIHSLGVKEIIRLPKENNFGTNRVIHTFGFPNRKLTPDIFGGGTLYSLGSDTVAVGLILALDWRYCDLDPQRELQLFKSHRFVSKLIERGEVIGYGAKTLPEGGFYSKTGLVANGAVIIGDAAGLTSVKKLKGLHYAIKSGMLAAEAIFEAIETQDFSSNALRRYEELLDESFIMRDLHDARNYRQLFAKAGRTGLYLGIPLSLAQQWIPFRLKTEPDAKGMRRVRLHRNYDGGIDRLTAVSLSGTIHREDQPSHITFTDEGNCEQCGRDYGCHPCAFFCPAEVYKFEGERLVLNPGNCLHCQTCRIKCPNQIIRWQIPEGGGGPRYRLM